MVAGALVADLFAGSGALGIEALSRGAGLVTFVESDQRAVRALEGNVAVLGLASSSHVRPVDVWRWVENHGAALDLVLADPPYGFDRWEDLLALLATFPASLVVAESNHPVEAAGWDVIGVRRHGGTVVTQLRPRGATAT